MLLSPQQGGPRESPFAVQPSDLSQFSSFDFGRPTAFASGTKSCVTSLAASSTAPLCANPKRKRSHSDFVSSEETVSAPSPMIHSQSGTWLEENMEARAAAAPVAIPAESEFRGRKSQRCDATAGYDDITAAAIRRKLQNSTQEDSYRAHSGSPSSFSSMKEPQVDDFTQLLGISWQRIPTDDRDIAAAIRGWERYINNHYARYIQNSEIILKHKGLNAYVVAARAPAFTSNGWANASLPASESSIVFYLFNEDLTEARLVASDWETCAARLRCAPIAFEEGSEVITASNRPLDQSQAKEAETNSGGLGMEMTMDLDS